MSRGFSSTYAPPSGGVAALLPRQPDAWTRLGGLASANSGHRKVRSACLRSSCDDSCASVVCSDRTILSSVVLRQDHQDTQGIHPLHAAQAHHRHVPVAIRQALDEAAVRLDDIDGIAVTQGPGMPGCLSVGMAAAKALASVHSKPLVYVHHMHGMCTISHNSTCTHAITHRTDAAHVPFSYAAGLGRPYNAGPGPHPVSVPSAGQHAG